MNPVAATPYVFFLGIGGIGMSALARWFQANGHTVSGYDKTSTPLTEALAAEGIAVHYQDAVASIPAEVRENRAQTLVVLTPAIPKDHQEWAWLREQGYDIRKRSQVLGLLTQGRPTIAVAGTHGKTTTSSMVAHLLHHAGVPSAAFLGGISVNLGSNLLLPPTALELATRNSPMTAESVPVVVEADEYDRSFLTLYPDVAIVTSTDADHLDIYGHKDALVESFRQFVSQIKPGGTLILNHTADSSVAQAAPEGVRVIRYGLSPEQGPELYASNITAQGHQFRFDMCGPQGIVSGLELAVPGYHNVENMLAAACVGQLYELTPEQLQAAVADYRGVKRRFEFILTAGATHPDHVYVDDYAHHPREIEAFLRSLRALYPGRQLRVVFQPHLFSRTRDFAPGFAESLSLADEVVLMDIYPARELPMPGVTSELILSQITAPKKSIQSREQILTNAETDTNFDVLATVGAGDIDQLVPRLKNILNIRWNGAQA
ncbi:UDP-N-acetylmuramate--L-alanine ligase [Hymenobacter taeanensis]|uniref:UDP-N-acetylmuramate--L-alanine ligase n=1 Tax=Hymenobacter taeanensis TaxID=2735321 RepID=A0A6M6BH52_9BACT|nr:MULTISPECIES: UDP-N-acetylmuramate--L-alanine ligase [Hymenobacter]QJX47881.1 UDP-N-acetylmuramate--L-alanine ligase [Hymenobacter taeanensis]UOQ82677.1 UDP-N-acetylmuramate--L-alanine ligase [Hymenobacter sp. 5414T-23]